MSRCHTRGSIVGARQRPYFLTFSFIFARFGRFGGFVSAVLEVCVLFRRNSMSFFMIFCFISSETKRYYFGLREGIISKVEM